MRRPFAIIAAVTVCTAFETLLLMSTTVPMSDDIFLRRYDAVVWFAQLILIPAMAALFAYLIHGSCGWRRTALSLAATVPLGLLLLLVPLIAVGSLIEWSHQNRVMEDASKEFAIALFLLTVIWGLIIVQVFRFVRKMATRGIRLESERWLTERQSDVAPRQVRRRVLAIGWALWLPSLTVLLVFLFFPEVWGAFSQITQPRVVLPGYRGSISGTWFLLYRDIEANGSSHFNGLIGSGPARAPRRYANFWVPLSNWTVATLPYGRTTDTDLYYGLPKNADVIARRDFVIGNESMTCFQYRPSNSGQHFDDSWVSFVTCAGPTRLRAGFTGERMHLPAFYRMLEGIKK